MRAVLQPEESRVTCHVSRGRGPWCRGVLGTEVSMSGETPTSRRQPGAGARHLVSVCQHAVTLRSPITVNRKLEKVEGSRKATFVSG